MMERRHETDARLAGDASGFPSRQVMGGERQGAIPLQEDSFDEELIGLVGKREDLRAVLPVRRRIRNIGDCLARSDPQGAALEIAEVDAGSSGCLDLMVVRQAEATRLASLSQGPGDRSISASTPCQTFT